MRIKHGLVLLTLGLCAPGIPGIREEGMQKATEAN